MMADDTAPLPDPLIEALRELYAVAAERGNRPVMTIAEVVEFLHRLGIEQEAAAAIEEVGLSVLNRVTLS